MPSIEFGPKALLAARRGSAVDLPTAAPAKGPATAPGNDRAAAMASPQSAVVRSRELDPGPPPVDAERVDEIRRAIEQGTYPIVPARVADAMIAAGLLLRSGK